MKVLAVNGPITGIVERPERFAEEQKYKIEEVKSKMEFQIDGVEYMGVCRQCGLFIKKKYGCYYLVNENFYGAISVDVFHKNCH